MPNHRSLSPILGFDVSVGILPRKVVVCRDFILRAVATFWVMSLVGIYPGRTSIKAEQQVPRYTTKNKAGHLHKMIRFPLLSLSREGRSVGRQPRSQGFSLLNWVGVQREKPWERGWSVGKKKEKEKKKKKKRNKNGEKFEVSWRIIPETPLGAEIDTKVMSHDKFEFLPSVTEYCT